LIVKPGVTVYLVIWVFPTESRTGTMNHETISIINETINRLITLKQIQQSVFLVTNGGYNSVGMAKSEAYQEAIEILQSVYG
jgi:hypothetical protein